MKYIKLYENFEDFEETWIDEPIDENLKKGDRVIIIDKLRDYIDRFHWKRLMCSLIGREFIVDNPQYRIIEDDNRKNISCFSIITMEGYYYIPYDCAIYSSSKSNENFNSLNDFEEVWEEEPPEKQYKIVKWIKEYDEEDEDFENDFQHGVRFYLANIQLSDKEKTMIVKDFDKLICREFDTSKLFEITSEDIRNLKNNIWYITNGKPYKSKKFQKIKYKDLLKIGIDVDL